jgi:hypothetical protein
MSRKVAFGPGHPAYDANLDLFEDSGLPETKEPVAPPAHEIGGASQYDWPADITLRFPCGKCLAIDPISLIDPLTAHIGDAVCPTTGLLCEGKAGSPGAGTPGTLLHFRKADELWQTESGNRNLVKASSWERAVKKAGGQPNRADCPIAASVRPFYAPHGGYADND